MQEEVKTLATKFQIQDSAHQKETKKLQQTITQLEGKGSAVDKALASITLTERKISKHTKICHENSKRLDTVQNKQVDQDTVNASFKKFHLTVAKDNNAMKKIFKTNWSNINAAFLKHERKIMSIDREVKSIPAIITRNVQKVVAYTDAKYKEAILISKEHTNSSLEEERDKSDVKAAQLKESVEKIIQTSNNESERSIQTSINELKQELFAFLSKPPTDIDMNLNSKRSRDTSTLIDSSPNTVESPENLRKPTHKTSPRTASTDSSRSTQKYDPKDDPGEEPEL